VATYTIWRSQPDRQTDGRTHAQMDRQTGSHSFPSCVSSQPWGVGEGDLARTVGVVGGGAFHADAGHAAVPAAAAVVAAAAATVITT
jgi:hypothetical protein